MVDIIKVNLCTDANHTFESHRDIIGREGEGDTSRFELTIPEKLTGCSVYLDFEKPDGQPLRTPRLGVDNNVAIYDVVPYLLTNDGEIKVQAILISKDGQTWKSSIKRYIIKNSINADEEIPEKEDFMTEAQKVLDEVRQEGESFKEAETSRVEAEKKRAEAETARAEAEGKRVEAIKAEVDELKESKLNSAGISHSCSESGDTVSLDICAGGVVLRADQSRGSITIGGTDGHNPISIYSDSIAGIPYDDIASKGKVEALETQNTILKKRVSNLEGATLDFVEDSTEALTKTVPTNALPYAKIMKIGGKTYIEDTPEGFILKSAPVSELVSEGVNLIPFPYENTIFTVYGITFTVNDDGSITVNGTADGFATFSLPVTELKAGETYYISGSSSGVSVVLSYCDINNPAETMYLGSATFTWKSNWRLLSVYLQVSPSATINSVTIYPMLNKGTTALPYRPYFKRTFPIPEEVRPAHTFDYIEWCEDGTRKKYECSAVVDASTLEWWYDSTVNVFYTASLNNKKAFGRTNVLCTKYETTNASLVNMPDRTITGGSSDSVLRIKDTEYGSDLASFRTSLIGVMLAYELKTPIVTDISDILTDDNYIEVQGGGEIYVYNGGKGAPTTINYITDIGG